MESRFFQYFGQITIIAIVAAAALYAGSAYNVPAMAAAL